MEGSTGQENIDRGGELVRSCSDTSVLTAVNVKQDNSRAWTDEKHNSYLNHLEMSFVTQLNRSKELPIRCTDQGWQSTGLQCQGQFIDIEDDSDQFTVLREGHWLKIKYQRSSPLSGALGCSFSPCKTSLVGSKSMEAYSPPLADSPKLKRLCNTEKPNKGAVSHGFPKCSLKLSYGSYYRDDSALCTSEGTGQNFYDGDNHNKTTIGSPMKRLRTASACSSIQDQIVPLPSQKSSGNGNKVI